MKTQINTKDQNSQQIKQNPINHLSPEKLKTNHLTIVAVVSICFVVFGFGGYYLGKQSTSSFQDQSPNQPITSPSPTVLQTSIPEGWKSYSIPQLNLNFNLPTKISTLGTWSTEVIPGSTGNKVCFRLKEKQSLLVRTLHAAGIGMCSGNTFTIHAASNDFRADRGPDYGDISGYLVTDNNLFVNKNNPKAKSTPKELYEIKTNENGVEYALLVGRNEQNGELMIPVVGTPGDGQVSALINTNNPVYPGVTVTMKLGNGFDKQLLDDILSTFKFVD